MSPANKEGTYKKRNDRKLTLFGLLSRDGNACGGCLLRTCRLSNFTGYLRVTTKWELQPQVANSASRSPVPTSLFGLMEQKHADLEKFTQTADFLLL